MNSPSTWTLSMSEGVDVAGARAYHYIGRKTSRICHLVTVRRRVLGHGRAQELRETLERLDGPVSVETDILGKRELLHTREHELAASLVLDRDKKLSLAGELLQKPLEIR